MSNEPITKHDEFAKSSPVDFDMVCKIFGGEPDLTNDQNRAAFFAVWAQANYEYAKAMLEKRIEIVTTMW
jgi:hypothetical protein